MSTATIDYLDMLKQIQNGMTSVATRLESGEKATKDMTDKFDGWQKLLAAHSERLSALEKTLLKDITQKAGNEIVIPKDQWSWSRYCLAMATGKPTYAPYECGVCAEYEQKTQTAGDFASGGSLIPPQYVAELIGFLSPELITERLGVRRLTGLTGSPLYYPKLTSGASYAWIGEDTAPSVSTMKTGALKLQPHKLAAFIKITKELIMLSSPSIEAAVRADLVRALSEGLDTAFFQGTGLNNQPIGLANNNPAILDAGGNWAGAADDLARINILKDLRKKLGVNNALRGRLAWAVNTNSFEAIDRLADANKRPYLVTDPGNGLRATLLGFPLVSSNLVAPLSGTGLDVAYLGNWEDTVLAIWANMDITSTTQGDTSFLQDELWVKATLLADVGVRRNVSFCKQAAVS